MAFDELISTVSHLENSQINKLDAEEGLKTIASWQGLHRKIKARVEKQLNTVIPQTIDEISNFISSISENWKPQEIKNVTFALRLTISAILKGKDPTKVMVGAYQPKRNLPMIDESDYGQMY